MDPLKHLVITPEMVVLIASLDEFKGRWEALGRIAPERLSVLRRVATIESVASSTRIEGATLTDEEVDRLLSGLQVHSFLSRDEQEVAGYADVMELVFEVWRELTLTENHVKQLHGILLKHSAKDDHHRGHYKTVPNHVEAFDPNGLSLGIIFQTATPFDTPRLMSELVDWARDALHLRQQHPLLVVATFIVRLLAIHPFQDGNGRLSRVITTLLLLRTGYLYVPYSSLERVIEDNKDEYYRALRRAQSTLDTDESQLGDWITFFLKCLNTQREALSRKIDRERIMAPLAPLTETLLKFAREHNRVDLGTAVAVTGANRSTVRAHLKKLVNANLLIQLGRGRGTWYEPA